MTNAHTPHSRRLRAATATARNERLLAEGYRRLNILISPAAAQRLAELAEHHGSKTAAIEALLWLAEKADDDRTKAGTDPQHE